jgi:hypothetical protein
MEFATTRQRGATEMTALRHPLELKAVDLSKFILRINTDFTNGVCCGYLTYYDKHQGLPLNDLDVYHFIAHLDDERYSNGFNAGYVTGWIEALIEDRDLFAVPEVS